MMEKKIDLKDSIRKSILHKRDEINLADFSLVKSRNLIPDQELPLMIEPSLEGVNLTSWATDNKESIRAELANHGGILFRNFAIDSPAKFEAFARAVSADGELFDEYGDLPRDTPGAKVYHSTPYPADKTILFHNESSHTHRWPMKIWFYCVKPAEQGGATAILDCHRLYETIDPAIIKRLSEKKLMYLRNFIEGLDVSWQQFFQTTDQLSVENYCRQGGIEFEWKGQNRLTTKQVCQAVARHPHTGKMVFFNQIQLHHISCLDPEVRASMLSMFRPDELPRNVMYGDGTPIEDSIVAEISEVFNQQAIRFDWQVSDVILLDNMLVSHSRDPFEGTRKVLVAMAEVVTQKDIQP